MTDDILSSEPTPVEATSTEAAPVEAAPVESAPVEATDFISTLAEEHRALAESKGFNSADDAIKSYSELQKLMGKRIEDMTADEIKLVNTKLGAPESIDGYEFNPIEGMEVDQASLDAYKQFVHESGISKDQAEGVFNWFQEYQAGLLDQMALEQSQAQEANVEELKREFGQAFDERVNLAKQALRQFGGEEAINAITEAGLGSNPAIVRMLAEVGKLTAEEAAPVAQGNARNFGKTPQEARAELDLKRKDSAWMRSLTNPMDPGYATAQKEFESLSKAAKGSR